MNLDQPARQNAAQANDETFFALDPNQDKPLPDPEKIPLNNLPFDPSPYLRIFEASYPEEVRLLERMRVHPNSGPALFRDPFGEREVKDDFSNIGEHCVAVAACASVLAEALRAAGHLDSSDVDYIVRRALVHDAAKPYDVFLNKATRENLINTSDYLNESIWDRVKPVLINEGLTAAEAAKVLDDFGAETGGRPDCLKRFLAIGPNGLQGIVAEELRTKVIHLADDMVCSTPPGCPPHGRHWALTPLERVSAAFAGKKAPLGWIAGFGLNAEHELVHLDNVFEKESAARPLGTYHGIMIWISNVICREVALFTGQSSQTSGSPEQTVKALVNRGLVGVS